MFVNTPVMPVMLSPPTKKSCPIVQLPEDLTTFAKLLDLEVATYTLFPLDVVIFDATFTLQAEKVILPNEKELLKSLVT